MSTNLQGSSHRPRAVGFRLRNRKDFIYEMIDENSLHVRLSLNGESCEASAVEARIIEGYTEA